MGLQDIMSTLSGGLSGSNKYASFPSSNNSTPDAPDTTSAPQAPQAQQAQPQAPQQPQAQPLGPQLSGIKGYLSSIFYDMGEAAKKHVGLPTDFEKQQAQQKINIEQQKASADAFEKQSQAQWRQNMTAQNAPAPIMDPTEAQALGLQVGDMISPSQKFALYKEKLASQGKANVAQIGANARLGAAQITALSRMSQTSMKAAYMPDGTLGVGLYDKAGNFRGYADNAVVPAAYLEKIHHGQEFKVDADGTLQAIPTTSTSQPLVPPNPASQPPNKLLQSPQPPNPQNIKNLLSDGAAKAGQVATGVNAKPVISNGKPFQTATAADTVYALDPKTNTEVATTRADAATKGLQITANKVSPTQVRKDQSLSNRLADVQRKVGDYADAFSQPIDAQDKMAISYLMDNNIGAGISVHGVSTNLLPQYLQSQLKARGMQALSENGMRRLIQFNQARESLSGYQQILTNSSRGSDKILELQLEQLPPPLADSDFANMSTGEFQKNIDLAGQHIPMFPGSAETQQSIKAEQFSRRQARSGGNAPSRPANVPGNYIFKQNGPKGTGWYKP